LNQGLAFASAFLVVLIVWSLLARAVSALIGATPLRPLDRLLGAAFGVVRGAVVLLAFATLVAYMPAARTEAWRESVGAAMLEAVLQGLLPLMPGDTAPPPQAVPDTATWRRTIVPDDVLLFRYSALTFNAHRIHYDRRYVTEVEGYPGLVVHGPLIATLLLDLLRREEPDAEVASFRFRAVRPTFDLHPFHVHGAARADGRSVHLWATDHEGWLTMDATALLR
jgi:acyl dehydratase